MGVKAVFWTVDWPSLPLANTHSTLACCRVLGGAHGVVVRKRVCQVKFVTCGFAKANSHLEIGEDLGDLKLKG